MAKYDKWIEPDGLLILEAWARDGLTDETVAEKIGIVPSTLYEWKKKYSEISEALKRGKEVVDIEVENALLNNAKGFTYTEQVISTKKEVIYKDGKRVKEISEPVVVEVERFKQPETTAQIFWLKNRKPKEWRDKTEVAVTQTKSEAVDEMEKYLAERSGKT